MVRLIPGKYPLFPAGRENAYGVFLDGELRATRKSYDDAWRVASMALHHLGYGYSEQYRFEVRWVDPPKPELSDVERALEDALRRMRELEGHQPDRPVHVRFVRCGHTATMLQCQIDYEHEHWSNSNNQICCQWCGKYSHIEES